MGRGCGPGDLPRPSKRPPPWEEVSLMQSQRPKKHEWAHMTWVEIRDALAANPVVMVPSVPSSSTARTRRWAITSRPR